MRICITRSDRNSYSETFIRDQISGLSNFAEVHTIHSGRLPQRRENGTLLAPYPFYILHQIVKTITGNRNNYFGNYGLRKFFLENGIDAVVANYGTSAVHLAPICSKLGIPLLAIFHGHDASDEKLLKTYAKKYKTLFDVASSIIVVSQEMRKKIIELGADPTKVSVIPCGVDPGRFKASTIKKAKIFLGVGRFVDKKGPLYTIRAFHEVWKRRPEAKLVMVGAHRGLYAECVQLTNALDMQDAVSFPGILRRDDIRILMNRAVAFVQHSVTAWNGDMEGTPVSILEAAACQLPVVSTFHGGIKDAVVHCKTGFLVREGDFSAMASYMLKLLDDEELAAAMGLEAREHVKNNYNQKNQLKKLYDLTVQSTAKDIYSEKETAYNYQQI